MLVWTVLIASVLAVGAFLAGQTRASALRVAGGPALHSLPTYHGLFLASGVITGAALAGLAAILLFGTQSIAVPAAAALGAAGTGAALYPRIASAFRARNLFERFVLAVLVLCSAVAVLTTIGIVFSVVFETIIFFRQVSPLEFLFSARNGRPPRRRRPSASFPLLVGTLLITFIAILVAGPLGLLSAIYMAEYASPRMRGVLKPLLEMLAGIPTVVLGFFAALTVAPLIRGSGESIGLTVASESALAAGLVMGMMIVPLISSLSDDIINAVPQSLRDGSYAMGATKSETIKRVVLPGSASGHRLGLHAGHLARHRRNHDRGHGRRACRQSLGQSAGRRHHHHRADRNPAGGRPGIRLAPRHCRPSRWASCSSSSPSPSTTSHCASCRSTGNNMTEVRKRA